jgi:hypothetical protein
MNPIRPDESDFDWLMAYHLGALSDEEMLSAEKRISSSEAMKQQSNTLQDTLSPLSEYEVDIPAGLAQKIKFSVRAQSITVDSLLTQSASPAKKRLFFGRIADFVATAAAVLLIGSALLLSTGHARQQAQKALCAGNLCSLGSALGSYAADYNHQLPSAQLTSSEPWYDTENRQPRRSNLFILIKKRYTSPDFLICPEERMRSVIVKNLAQLRDFPAGTVVSYSFQNLNGDRQFGPGALQKRWDLAPHMPVMADRTPLMRMNTLAGEITSDKMLSPNHASLGGQNILVLDGRVTWQNTPVFGPQRDNIWKAGQIQRYSGREVPSGPVDCFLAP